MIYLDSSKLNLSVNISFKSSEWCTVLDKEWSCGGDVSYFEASTLAELQSVEC